MDMEVPLLLSLCMLLIVLCCLLCIYIFMFVLLFNFNSINLPTLHLVLLYSQLISLF